MTEDKRPLDEQQVWCRRLARALLVTEHAGCLYCFGNKQQIEHGEHAEFCDFKPGKDPIHFGFPLDTSRNLTD